MRGNAFRTDAGEGDGRERGGRGDAWAGSQAMLASPLNNKKELPPSKVFTPKSNSSFISLISIIVLADHRTRPSKVRIHCLID